MRVGTQRKRTTDKSYRTLVKQGFQISLPDNQSPFRLGQRVYFSVEPGRIFISPHPVRARNGRLPSPRIRRNTDSWFRHRTGLKKGLVGR